MDNGRGTDHLWVKFYLLRTTRTVVILTFLCQKRAWKRAKSACNLHPICNNFKFHLLIGYQYRYLSKTFLFLIKFLCFQNIFFNLDCYYVCFLNKICGQNFFQNCFFKTLCYNSSTFILFSSAEISKLTLLSAMWKCVTHQASD